MNRRTLSNFDKIAILLVFVGTIMVIGGGFTERTETQVAGIIMWVAGGLQMMNSRMTRIEKKIRHHH